MTASESTIARVKAAIACVQAGELEAARLILEALHAEAVGGDSEPESDPLDGDG